MRALVIGGCGFVGRYLTRYLKQCGYETIVTKMHAQQTADEADIVCELDILEKAAVERLLEKTNPDVLFHLAAQSSVAASWNDPGQCKCAGSSAQTAEKNPGGTDRFQ